MKATTRPAADARRSATLGPFARALAVATLAAPLLGLTACGGSTAPDDRTGPIDTSTLVGTWSGTVDGGSGPNSFGLARLTVVLRADSTFTTASDNPLYCSMLNTRWTVSGSQFTATGRDCTGTGITLTAPVASLRLNGTWTATSGRGGTFNVGKE
jgi:hypothetical protein